MSETTKNPPHGNDDRFKDALIFGYLEGKLNADQLEAFDAALCNDREFSQRFVDTALLMQTLQSPSVSGQLLVDYEEAAEELPFGGSAAWESAVEDALASKRRSEIEHEAGLLLAQDKVERNRETRLEKLKRDQETKPHQTRNYVIPIWSIPVAIAAAIMLVAIPLAMLFQDKPEPNQQDASTPDAPIDAPYVAPVLATVVRTLDAQWLDDDELWNGTTGLREGEHHLASGLVEIELSEGTRVVLEAPITFELTGTNALKLSRGRLVATVPPAAIGFTVNTPSALIIDYGTEFGVEARVDGTTQAHVFRGEIRAAAHRAGGVVGEPVTLLEDQAAEIERATGEVKPVAFRAVDFERRVVTRLDVLDIVAGGDGLGARRGKGINPESGRQVSEFTHPESQPRVDDPRYCPVSWSRYIDGVFVAADATQSDRIDSAGHRPRFMHETGQRYLGPIWAMPMSEVGSGNEYTQWAGAIEQPELYSPRGLGLLVMHSNAGITFDLQALQANGGSTATRFTANAANAETHKGVNPFPPRNSPESHIACSIYVVVDGEIRFKREGFNSLDGVFEIDVELRAGDRFLSIIVSDSDGRYNYDWAVLGDPVIELSPATFAGE